MAVLLRCPDKASVYLYSQEPTRRRLCELFTGTDPHSVWGSMYSNARHNARVRLRANFYKFDSCGLSRDLIFAAANRLLSNQHFLWELREVYLTQHKLQVPLHRFKRKREELPYNSDSYQDEQPKGRASCQPPNQSRFSNPRWRFDYRKEKSAFSAAERSEFE